MAWYDQTEHRDHFVRNWRDMLRALLRWSDERAERWARYCWHRHGDNPFLTHETAAWYVTRLLVPPPLRSPSGAKVVRLEREIERAIESTRSSLPPYDCDFAAARSRVQAVLRGHGFSLPESEDQADREGWRDPESVRPAGV